MMHMKCTTLTFYSELKNITFDWNMVPIMLKNININSEEVGRTFFINIHNIHNNIECLSFTNIVLTIEMLDIIIDKWPKVVIYYNDKILPYEKIEINIL